MTITSDVFQSNEIIPKKYTCDGEDISPPLHFENIPPETKTLVLIVNDPDAPRGDWVHWTVFNIDPSTTDIAENSAPPEAVEGTTDLGHPGYGGPCPPSGRHRYHFRVFALDCALDLDESATKDDIEGAMTSHILDQAALIGMYQRTE